MPSRSHEIPLRLVQNQPALAPVLLREVLDYPLPEYSEVASTSEALTNCDPKEWNVDSAVVLRQGTRTVLGVAIERQNCYDPKKRYSWYAYLATLCGRLECPAVLVVLCPDRALARWCARPFETGHPDFVLRPLVIGPDDLPVVAEVERARELPELAVLSARAHGSGDVRTLKALVEALDATADRNRAFYYDYVLSGLNEPRGTVCRKYRTPHRTLDMRKAPASHETGALLYGALGERRA